MAPFFEHTGPVSLSSLCSGLNIPLPSGCTGCELIHHAKPVQQAGRADITHFSNVQYAQEMTRSNAGFCLVRDTDTKTLPPHTVALITEQPYRDWAFVLSQLYREVVDEEAGISPLASIHPSAQIGRGVTIGAFTVIKAGVVVGDHTRIGSHVSLQNHVCLGDDGSIGPHVSLSHCHIGHGVCIKPGARIGQRGFGFHMDEGGHVDVPQMGMVYIGDGSEIGANVCIDRGSMHHTVIGRDVRIDNLVQIAHNVEVGDHSVLVAQVGIAGSSKLGRFVVVAGQAGIAGHLHIGDGAQIAAQSGVIRSVEEGQVLGGTPAMPAAEWHKQTVLLKRLLREREGG